jgi:Calcineurin-like phosphoesterase
VTTELTVGARTLKILTVRRGATRRFGRVAGAAALAALATVCDVSSPSAAAGRGSPAFTVVVLPDTQYYAAEHPEILQAQAEWIVSRRAAEQIALVLHEGDIVDADEPRQWQAAARSLHELDGVVPYVLCAGNHDYRRAGPVVSRDGSMSAYFPPASFASRSWFRGTFEAGRIEDSYEIVDLPGGPWLILSLEFGARDAVLAWADGIAKRHAGLPAIVVTHAYLDSDGTRYDHVARPDQLWNPHRYLSDAHPGDVNDGEEIWRKLVARNDNILFVLCGHDLVDGVGRLTSVRRDGTRVHQLLANYQTTEALGGEGYLRLMRFFPAEQRVVVQTYSPYADRFKTDPQNEFTLDY